MVTVTILIFHIILSLGMIGFILMHRGSDAGLSDMFGGGMSQLRGSAVVERNLDRLTVITAIGFAITTVLLGLRL